MNTHLSSPRHTRTRYISLDTKSCKACWTCLGACPQKVFGKVNLPFHKHAHIDRAENCKGCLRCVTACPTNALRIAREDEDYVREHTVPQLRREAS